MRVIYSELHKRNIELLKRVCGMIPVERHYAKCPNATYRISSVCLVKTPRIRRAKIGAPARSSHQKRPHSQH